MGSRAAEDAILAVWEVSCRLEKPFFDAGVVFSPNKRIAAVIANYQLLDDPELPHVPGESTASAFRLSEGRWIECFTHVFDSWAHCAIANSGALLALEQARAGVRWSILERGTVAGTGHLLGIQDIPEVRGACVFLAPLAIADYEIAKKSSGWTATAIRICTENEFDPVWCPAQVHLPEGLSHEEEAHFDQSLEELRILLEATIASSHENTMVKYLGDYLSEAASASRELGKGNKYTGQKLIRLAKAMKRFVPS